MVEQPDSLGNSTLARERKRKRSPDRPSPTTNRKLSNVSGASSVHPDIVRSNPKGANKSLDKPPNDDLLKVYVTI
jgi:hypothetical protein